MLQVDHDRVVQHAHAMTDNNSARLTLCALFTQITLVS